MPIDPKRVRDIFLAAAELPAADRPAHLAEACAGDADLRAAVERLLAAHVDPASVLDSPAANPLPTTGPHTPQADSGTILAGRYKLLEPIGEGGMGSVWTARQTEPVKRMVAVKLIKPGMDSKTVLARFEAERQALALMDHPNIARVFDASATAEGLPFFVMELVKGVPITKFCDDRRLTLRERLELFVPVCQAIQHAHQKGVIHRDIKPSNVLVALYDDRPVPKVIDFGVAKAIGQPLTEHTLNTGFGTVVGTPQYMSPEQATFNNLDVDTRSDLYSLGVLLYELLVGSPPFTKKDLDQAGVLEMLRVVREVEPPRPSTKLSTADALPSLAANRSTEPKKLTGMLRNELDWVVMKALEKDRTRRYETANGFAADILRYLSGEPVQAVPPSLSYRLRKFVGKNRSAVVAASLVLLTLVGGIAGTTWGLIRAENRREDAVEAQTAEAARVIERDDALGKLDKALSDTRNALGRESLRVKERDDANIELRHQLGDSNYLLAFGDYEKWDVKQAAERLDKVPTIERGWEWAYLKRQLNGGIFTLYGHTDVINSVGFSPDGMRIVTGSRDGTAKVWDARTGTLLLDLKEHTREVMSVSFSPDGTRIATASQDAKAKVWDARTGTCLIELKGHKYGIMSVSFSPDGTKIITGGGDGTKVWDVRTGMPLLDLERGHTSIVMSVGFSPDGTRIITGESGNGKSAAVKVWDARTGSLLIELKGHTSIVHSVSFSSDGTRIVTASHDKTARVWDARTGTLLLELKGHTNAVMGASFSPDGTRIVTGGGMEYGRPGEVKVWDARTGMPQVDLKGHTHWVTCVGFSPDGTRIVSSSYDMTAKMWDARTGSPLIELRGHTGFVNSVCFSPDGTRIVTGSSDQTSGVWDACSGMPLLELKGHKGGVTSASFSLDGTRIVTGSFDKTAKVWDAHTGMPLLELKGHTSPVACVSFSPDGTRIVTGSSDPGKTGEAKVWDAHTGTHLFDLEGHRNLVTSICFSPDGSQIVTSSTDGTLKFWDARTGTLQLDLKPKTGIMSVRFSPDGTRIATGHSFGVEVLNARTGTSLFDLKGHTSFVYSVEFSPDGTRIVTGSADHTAKVWDARTGMPLLDLKGHEGNVTSVSFSPDGTRIATGSWDATVKVWDARTGRPPIELKADTLSVTSVCFSPDGTRIVTGSGGNIAKVWDTRTGILLLELKGHTSSVTSVSFSPDGTRIVTGSYDKTAKIWHAHTGTIALEILVHKNGVGSVRFSPDGTRIVTVPGGMIVKPEEVMVWDARTGQELKGEQIPPNGPPAEFSPDGKLFAHRDGDRVVLIPLTLDAEELDNRLVRTKPNVWQYYESYSAARKANDHFATRFYFDRILSLSGQRTTPWFKERNTLLADPLVIARTGFHHPPLAKTLYDRGTLALLAANGDRLAQRLLAQDFLRDGKPGPAIPLLFLCAASRPAIRPPVEELLLAQAYLDLKQPAEARRFYEAATEWLDRPGQPIRAANIVTHSALNPWGGLVAVGAPIADPRRDPFDWEAWHECDVFRVDVERRMAGKP